MKTGATTRCLDIWDAKAAGPRRARLLCLLAAMSLLTVARLRAAGTAEPIPVSRAAERAQRRTAGVSSSAAMRACAVGSR